MKIYDEDEYANATYEQISESCALGFIPLDVITQFSNRENYLCLWAEKYRKFLSKEIDEYDDALRDLVMEFGSAGYEGTLDSHGSNALEKAFKILNCENGDSSFCVWGIHEGLEDDC